MNMNANTLNPPRSQSQSDWTSQSISSNQFQPVDDLVEYVTSYARQNPGTAALWCFGLGFIVGWRLKPW
jgi:hypothetical protein